VPAFIRTIVIVLDSVGIGELPDARAYGDEGSNTVGNIAKQVPLKVPVLRSLGLGQFVTLGPGPGPSRDDSRPICRGAYGRMAEASAGKDSVTGHWEMMGIVLDRPFPTFPAGFPADFVAEFERRIARGTLGNVVASGTEIVERLGSEHLRAGKPILYTSADSVLQIAAHEGVIALEEQYRICEIAFDLAARGLGVGRVIARPFVGVPGAFLRTPNRHDYVLDPTGETLLDLLKRRGHPVTAIGKIGDLFAGRGITCAVKTSGDADGIDRLEDALREMPDGMILVNLVDCDTMYGHRNDVPGYAANLERFDERLGRVIAMLRTTDLLAVTADHGNDPTTRSTDHSREYVPLLLTGPRVRVGTDLGTRRTFADLGQTLAENFGVGPLARGTSFLGDLVVQHP